MKTLKTRTINKGDFKGEKLSVVILNKKEQQENNNDLYAVVFGEYKDIDFSCGTEKEAIDFYKDWEN
jgi:hypothetical protein